LNKKEVQKEALFGYELRMGGGGVTCAKKDHVATSLEWGWVNRARTECKRKGESCRGRG